ncbi:hypothetical protein AgCh_037824 [Apium graveolens]
MDWTQSPKLRSEVLDLKKSNSSLRAQLSDFTRDRETNSAKMSSLMNENTNISNECSSLSLTVKKQVIDLAKANSKIATLKVEHGEALRSVVEARVVTKKDFTDAKDALASLEEESFQLFEEGYRECWKSMESRGFEVSGDRWEDYLKEEQGRIRGAVKAMPVETTPVTPAVEEANVVADI